MKVIGCSKTHTAMIDGSYNYNVSTSMFDIIDKISAQDSVVVVLQKHNPTTHAIWGFLLGKGVLDVKTVYIEKCTNIDAHLSEMRVRLQGTDIYKIHEQLLLADLVKTIRENKK